jgi:hypothetical protein
MPRLSVVAGPSLDALVPITVNSGIPHNIVSDAFEGQVLAYIKGFTDEDGNTLSGEGEYFQREDRKGITWSIQTQGTLFDLVPVPFLRGPPAIIRGNDWRALGTLQGDSFVPSLLMMCSLVTRLTVP